MQTEFNEALQADLSNSYDKNLDAQSKWNLLRNSIYSTAIGTYGKKVRRNADWFEANVEVMKPILEAERTALVDYKDDPNPQTSAILKNTKKAAQQAARSCANKYWLQLCQGIQHAADTGNVRGMYEGIKKALGPTVKKTAPLKLKSGEPVTDSEAQMDRWVEHYLELYSTENVVTEPALNSIKTLPVMEELDREPTMDEVSDAIDSLHNGKAPGSDNIPPEVIKCGKDVLCQHLHDFFCTCWKEGLVPQDLLTQVSSPYTRIKASVVTATIIVESPCSASSGKFLLASFSADFISLPIVYIRSHNAASEQADQPLI